MSFGEPSTAAAAAAAAAAGASEARSAEWCKPRPGMLLRAMEHAGAKPNQTLVIGHDVLDEEAARNAGADYFAGSGFALWVGDNHDERVVRPDAGGSRGAKAPQSFASTGKRGQR